MIPSSIPRIELGCFPTQLERLNTLSKDLGIELYVKHDDQTGLAGGGNKVRKLEYLIGDALAKGADTIITQGAVQSNHVRQTAAAAAKMGLKCRAVLERRIPNTDIRFDQTGNVFLNHLLGIAALRFVASGTDMAAEMEQEADHVRAEGGTPYIIPGGGSNSIGALGYVNATLELTQQLADAGLEASHIIVTSGSSGTQAGMAAALAALKSSIQLLGISIRQPKAAQHAKVYEEARKVAELLNIPPVTPDQVQINDQYIGEGYGIPTSGTKKAIRIAAQKEALLLDPVYTGKAFAALLDLAEKGYFKPREIVIFMHTGGAFGLFAYEPEFMADLIRG